MVLVANRGEIAVRIVRVATALGWTAWMAVPAGEPGGRASALAAGTVTRPGEGPGAYLDVEGVAAAAAKGCGLLHPGYGFASDRPALADACAALGVAFVGPHATTLARLGDKVAARHLATSLGVPVLAGTDGPTDDAAAARFWAGLAVEPAVMVGRRRRRGPGTA